MNKTAKIILIVTGAFVMLCMCGISVLLVSGVWTLGHVVRWAENSTSEDPQEVAGLAADISDFDLPDGFGSPYGMQLASFTVVTYLSDFDHTQILLAQFPRGTHFNLEEMLRNLQDSGGNPNSTWYNLNTTLVEQIPVTIRDQESTLNIAEGDSASGGRFRSASAAFQGKGGGPALILVSCPVDEWNMELIDELITSMK